MICSSAFSFLAWVNLSCSLKRDSPSLEQASSGVSVQFLTMVLNWMNYSKRLELDHN